MIYETSDTEEDKDKNFHNVDGSLGDQNNKIQSSKSKKNNG